jgi:hypothetical protein
MHHKQHNLHVDVGDVSKYIKVFEVLYDREKIDFCALGCYDTVWSCTAL